MDQSQDRENMDSERVQHVPLSHVADIYKFSWRGQNLPCALQPITASQQPCPVCTAIESSAQF